MAKLYAARSDGVLSVANYGAYDDFLKKYEHTVQLGSSTAMNNLIGTGVLCGGGGTLDASQEIKIDGAQQFEVFNSSNSSINGIPVVFPIQATKAANYVNMVRGKHTTGNTSATAGGMPNGSAAWENFSGCQYSNSATEATQTSSTFADRLTQTFTPATQQDYLIVAACRIRNTNISSGQPQARLQVDGVTVGNADGRGAGTGIYYPVGFMKRSNLTAASHTIKLQSADAGNFWGMGISQQFILSIPLANYTNAYTEGSNGTTSTSFADIASASLTLNGRRTILVVASVEITDQDSEIRIQVGGSTNYYEGTIIRAPSSGRFSCTWILPVVVDGSGSTSFALQGKNTTHTNPRICAIDVTGDINEVQVYNTTSIDTSSDDAEINATSSSMAINTSFMSLGKNAIPQTFHNAFRWPRVDLKGESTVDSAIAEFSIRTAPGSAFSITQEAIDEDNTATFNTTYSNWSNRAKTGSVAWTPGAVTMDKRQQASAITTLLQTISDRANWAQFNAFGMDLLGTNAATNNTYSFNGRDAHIGAGATLRLLWKEILVTEAYPDRWAPDTEIPPNRKTSVVGY